MTVLDDYFPMEVPPGAHSTIVRWRKMARQWCVPGVVRSHLGPSPQEPNSLMVWSWDRDGSATGTPYTATIAPGGCWVSGFYGVARNHTQLVCPGTGLVVCRFDPTIQDILFVFRNGLGPGQEFKDPNGAWELPLAYLDDAAGTITDLRRFIPLPSMDPPITELPAWLPRGFQTIYTGPETQVDTDFAGADVVVGYPGWEGWYIPGRHLRCSLYCSAWSLGGQAMVHFWARDTRGEQARVSRQVAGIDFTFSTSFVVQAAAPELVLVVTGFVTRFAPGSIRITVEDAGNGGPF
jgi:hypothetical protein